jgi:hypothetical protein
VKGAAPTCNAPRHGRRQNFFIFSSKLSNRTVQKQSILRGLVKEAFLWLPPVV